MLERKKLLYISTVERGPFQGVFKKMASQCSAFNEIGIDTIHINFGERSFFGQLSKLFPFSYGLNYRKIKKKILSMKSNTFQYCYVRYSPASRGLIDVLKTIKQTQTNIKIVVEIPTYPYDDELKSFKSLPFRKRDKHYRTKMKGIVDLIITPSHINNSYIFGIPALEITNGIDRLSILPKKDNKHDLNIINLLGVALITPRQGYDRIIKGIFEYLKNKDNDEPNVCFYIVGNGDGQKSLFELANRLNLLENVFFVGEKDGEELDYYYNIADLGVGVLGLYRSGDLIRTNSLKTREYCAKCLPFIDTECDYIFANSSASFCILVPNCDEPVDIRRVINQFEAIKLKFSRDNLNKEMIDFAEKRICWTSILVKVINYVDSLRVSDNEE